MIWSQTGPSPLEASKTTNGKMESFMGSEWIIDWSRKTATHTGGLKLQFIKQEEFNRKYEISPRDDRSAVHEPDGWVRLVVSGLKSDRPVNVTDIHDLLLAGQNAFLEEARRREQA